jgi:hypothetical protein
MDVGGRMVLPQENFREGLRRGGSFFLLRLLTPANISPIVQKALANCYLPIANC